MADGGNFWDPYCPCKVTRKNIVMTVLTILSFALVAWTVVVTGKGPLGLEKGNQTYIIVDDSKALDSINITMASTRIINAAKAAQDKKTKAIAEAAAKATMNKRAELKYIRSATDADNVLCKCLCGLNVTLEEVLTALEFVHSRNAEAARQTTTPAPFPITTKGPFDFR